MHGRACKERKRSRHMWTVSLRATASLNAVRSSAVSLSSSNSFFKDGRKISVGDCALFKPLQDCPPFIGIIRWVAADKENKLKLGVNWLYRPAEVKLGKAILLEAAPNEIFYSFHKDEIPAASLLHPCKVAFLPKGSELPSGICSFVCWRVYDITNKCLWWLTDQDYIDERQEEVDQLLYKTRLEMHATVQPGGRSPKQMNGPTSQLKSGSDSAQNSSSSYSSQTKGKKRERLDQGSEPVKKERPSRMEDNESGHARQEGTLKSEIAKITEKGGLVDSEGVEKLVQLMLPQRNEKKIDLTGRLMLAGVVASTDKSDCLSRFVQLRGLPVFDEWLQEVHKGKIGDGSPKDGDKSTEEFLLVLLRALDKLPINLNALQMCNIGKSVNHLRTHKNVEIVRKARSLVDTWKKRVEAEMDMKSSINQGVSWSARPRLPEASHSASRHSGGSSTDLTVKSSASNVGASKPTSIKLVQVENNTKSASQSPASLKSTLSHFSGGTNAKDGQLRTAAAAGVSDSSVTVARDEKSSSSSQSHNNSQSCSSDHAKTAGFSGKEDPRSSTAASMSVNKNSNGSSRHRKSNGFQGLSPSTTQRENASSRSSFQRNTAPEKLSQPVFSCEKALETPAVEGSSHKLIVKLPNRGCSPGRSANGGAPEDQTVMNSRVSSPVFMEKHDQVTHNTNDGADATESNTNSDVNNESWQTNDVKDVRNGSDEGPSSPSAGLDEEHWKTVEGTGQLSAVMKATSPSSANTFESVELNGKSLSSINALIESCVKFSETNATIAVGDDLGMNLLASVAAGEISKSNTNSPACSPQVNTAVVDQCCLGNVPSPKSFQVDDSHKQPMNCANGENDKQHVAPGMISKDAEKKMVSMLADGDGGSLEFSSKISLQSLDQHPDSEGISKQPVTATKTDLKEEKILDEDRKLGGVMDVDGASSTIVPAASSLVTEGNGVDPDLKVESEAAEVSASHKVAETDSNNRLEQKTAAMVMPSEVPREKDEHASHSSGSGKNEVSGNVDEPETDKVDEMDANAYLDRRGHRTDGEFSVSVAIEEQSLGGSVPSNTHHKADHAEEIHGSDEVNKKQTPAKVSSPTSVKETDQHGQQKESRLSNAEADEGEEHTSGTRDASSVSAAGALDTNAKVGFDLNEGFDGDDARIGDLNNSIGVAPSMPPQYVSPMPLPTTVTVAAAAKRPFVPPEDLLKSRGTIGWKGSAATSAFRPAEPRKALEVSLGTTLASSSSDPTAGKHGRPPLDIDLNVPDERILEDLASRNSGQFVNSIAEPTNKNLSAGSRMMASAPVVSSGGLDLDLNRVEEPNDMGNYTSNNHRLDVSFRTVKSSSGTCRGDEAAVRRDFDLNDGPAIDDLNTQPSLIFNQHARASIPSHPIPSGIRVNTSEIGNYSSWFPSGNIYSQVTVPSMMADRSEQPFPVVTAGGPQRMANSAAGGPPFTAEVYRGPVLPSSPAVPFQSAPFQYPVFPFGPSFPLASATFSGGSAAYVDSSSGGRLCFPGANTPLFGPALAVPSNYPRPYVVGLPDSNSGVGSETGRKCLRQGLDLNAGPAVLEPDSRDEGYSLAPRQLISVSGPQTVTEEPARIYQISGVLKRKEPDTGWDGFKQSSWQ